ncbi:MAG: hypothetical protein Q7J17_04150 [Candidatus Deferrimicrobium sp.]|nr:hypothetical protein [Candidatus Deferrimicrobium sp.]MDO8738148.1 hypothetical protein [Candidatus Deferrimicrobium sp.]
MPGKFPYFLSGDWTLGDEPLVLCLMDEPGGGKSVRFLFLFVIDPVPIQKNIPFAVAEYVPRLVEEGKPQVIVGLVPQAKLDKRFVAGQPPGSATHWRAFASR